MGDQRERARTDVRTQNSVLYRSHSGVHDGDGALISQLVFFTPWAGKKYLT